MNTLFKALEAIISHFFAKVFSRSKGAFLWNKWFWEAKQRWYTCWRAYTVSTGHGFIAIIPIFGATTHKHLG